MKTSSSTLQALLASRQFWAADLYAITLIGGGSLLYSAGDCDVIDPASGLRYVCGGMVGPYFDRAASKASVHQKLGTDVDTLVIDILPGAASVLGVPFLQAVRQGVFDGAMVQCLRAYAPTVPPAGAWPVTVTGTLIRFTGFIAEADVGGSVVTFTINSPMDRLQSKLPRNLYQPGCINVLGDAGCGIALAAWQVTGAVAAGSSAAVINATLAPASGWFDLGTVAFTSGVLAGLSRSVRAYTQGSPGSLALMVPFPQAPAPGDAFVASPGCDGTMDAGGCPKFSNLAHYRGFPFVPAPTTAGA